MNKKQPKKRDRPGGFMEAIMEAIRCGCGSPTGFGISFIERYK